MGSTVRTADSRAEGEATSGTVLRWRSWPLAENPSWSWLVPAAIVGTGFLIWSVGGGWLLAVLSAIGATITLWQFLLPVTYEISALGVHRQAFRRTRLVPWQAVRALRLRPTGIVLFRRTDPIALDLLGSLFVPYPPDEDDLLYAVRQYVPHAVDLAD
jgi:hypothetical protein